jgi:hypothetical protein
VTGWSSSPGEPGDASRGTEHLLALEHATVQIAIERLLVRPLAAKRLSGGRGRAFPADDQKAGCVGVPLACAGVTLGTVASSIERRANRHMRRFARVVLLVVGVLLTLIGGLTAVLVGTDGVVRAGDRELTTDTAALTAPASVLDFMGPTLHVAATTRDGRDVFVGIAHEVDVADYLDGVARDQVQAVNPPATFDIERVDGAVSAPETEPASRDWWYVQSSGPEWQAIEYELGTEPVNVVIMAADGEPPLAVEAEVGLEIENLFVTALIGLGVGLIILAVGILALRPRRRRPRAAHLAEPDETWYEETQP